MTSHLIRSPEKDDRQQRLDAIAQLELEHRLRRSGFEQSAQSDPTSSREGKYFLLLVSKGSGSLQQRANQDRAETMLRPYPRTILDGSNFALAEKRNELFAISQNRGNYPQLFLVDDGTTTFIGDYDVIEYHNDEGTLGSFVEDSKSSKGNKLVTTVKGLVKKTKSKKKKSSSASTLDSPSENIRGSPLNGDKAPMLPHRSGITASSLLAPEITHRSSSMGYMDLHKSRLSPDQPSKPASMGRILAARSDGHLPLASPGKEPKSERRSRSKSQSRRDSKRSTSKSRGAGESKKSITRSRSRGKYTKREGEDQEEGDTTTRSTARSKSKSKTSLSKRSSSKGRVRESARTNDIEEGMRRARDRSASRGRRLDNGDVGPPRGTSRGPRSLSRGRGGSRSRSPRRRGGSRSRSRGRKEKKTDNGADVAKDETSGKTKETVRTRSKSRSKRSMRTSGRTLVETGEVSPDRKPRSRKSLVSDNNLALDGSARNARRGTRLRDHDAEKHPKSRRNDRSTSPRREKVRSTSPGTFRGDIARKREMAKECREKKSIKELELDGDGSSRRLDSSGVSRILSPRRVLSGDRKMSVNKDESLNDLIKRVKEKEKGRVLDTMSEQAPTKDISIPSVQW